MLPKEPNTVSKAVWASSVPVMPEFHTPVITMTRAVQVSTTKVSMNTPIMAIMPWSSGWATLASAWAWGVEPIPASLEKRPRATP